MGFIEQRRLGAPERSILRDFRGQTDRAADRRSSARCVDRPLGLATVLADAATTMISNTFCSEPLRPTAPAKDDISAFFLVVRPPQRRGRAR